MTDLGALATNWQSTNGTWEQGDFNGDGLVDVTDLGTLETNWQRKQPQPACRDAAGRPGQRSRAGGDNSGMFVAAMVLRRRAGAVYGENAQVRREVAIQ